MSQIDWLQALDPDQLCRVLVARPDVLSGAPLGDLSDLALRLQHPVGLVEALRSLPAPGVQVLRVALLFAPTVTVDRVASLLEPWGGSSATHRDAVLTVMAQLAEHALLWPVPSDGESVEVEPNVHLLLDGITGLGAPAARIAAQVPSPALRAVVRRWGLPVSTRKADLVRAIAEQLADPAVVRRLLAPAPARVAQRLLALAEQEVDQARAIAAGDQPEEAGPFVPAEYRELQEAYAWAVENGLAFSRFGSSYVVYGEVELPSEVVLALAGSFAFPFTPEPPTVPRVQVDPAQVERSAAAAVSAALGAVMTVLEHLHVEPVTQVKAGGVGSRGITRLAKSSGAGAGEVRLALEAAWALGLLDLSRAEVTTSGRFDIWRDGPPVDRALDLLHAWWRLPSCPTVDRDEDGRVLPALDGRPGLMDGLVRTLVLAEDDGPGAPVSTQVVADRVRWSMPLLGPSDAEVLAVRAEAHTWGVLASEALSEIGTSLVAGDLDGLRDALTQALPAATSVVRIAPDLTAVAMGSPTPGLVDLLDVAAEREVRGPASVWRFTPASVREALDTGLDAAELLRRLTEVCEGTLPQPVDDLVRDVARRYGHVAVRPAGSVLTADQPALAAELLSARSLRSLGFTAVTESVLVASAPPAEVVPALRQAGYLPRELRGPGTPVLRVDRRLGPAPREVATSATAEVPRAVVHGVPSQRHGSATAPPRASVEPLRALAERMRSGVAPADDGRTRTLLDLIERCACRLDPNEIRQLAHAVAHRRSVRIDYRNGSGQISHRTVSELEVIGAHLRGWCHLRGDERVFRLDGLLVVAPVPEDERASRRTT